MRSNGLTLLGFILFFSASGLSFSDSTTFILGLENAKNYKTNSKGVFYLQAGTFSSKLNAYRYQKNLQSKIASPVIITSKNEYYIVKIGPIHTISDVRRIDQLLGQQSNQTHRIRYDQSANKLAVHQKNKPLVVADKDDMEPQLINNWFITVDVGSQWPKINSPITVPNGSDFPPPFNVDSLSTKKKEQLLFAASVGRRWQQHSSQWLPAYSLGVLYKHVFAKNIGNKLMQYSIPEFTNYTYDLKISSDVLLASTKFNLFQYSRFLPFFNGGLGVAFNHTSNYTETALPNVTPRISPAFTSHANSQLAFEVGLGVDFLVTQQFNLSVGYEFEHLGKLSSGAGVDTWSGQSLNLGSYQLNTIYLSASYLFPNQ